MNIEPPEITKELKDFVPHRFAELKPDFHDCEPLLDSDLGVLVHNVAAQFPKLGGKELDELLRDLELNAMSDPIVWDGQVLIDGRNRFAALLKNPDLHRRHAKLKDVLVAIGTNPQEPDGPPIVPSYIISKNLHRRHLSPKDKAFILAELHGGIQVYTFRIRPYLKELGWCPLWYPLGFRSLILRWHQVGTVSQSRSVHPASIPWKSR